MMHTVNTVEEALSLLSLLETLPEDASFRLSDVQLGGELATLKIWVDGPKYHASIPGEFARGLWEYQESFYKAAAFALTGSDDQRRLTSEQRGKLEFVFEVREGSLDIAAKVQELLKELVQGCSTMSEMNRIRTYLCLALIVAAGLTGWKALDNSAEVKKEEIKKELAIGIEAEKTKQMELFAKVANREPVVQRFDKAAEEGTKSIVRSASDANEIKVGRTHFDQEEIQEVNQRAPRTTSSAEVVEKSFRVFSADLRAPGMAKYTISAEGTGEFPVQINESEFSPDDLEKIWNAVRTRTEIKLEVNITRNRGNIRAAQLISVL